MRDEQGIDTQPTPNEPSADALVEKEIAEDDDLGTTDLLKAAKEGAKRLKKLEP